MKKRKAGTNRIASLARTGMVVLMMFFVSGLAGMGIAKERITIATSNVGGSWYVLGGAIAKVMNAHFPAYEVSTGPGSGAENVNFVGRKEADFGFTFTDSVHYGLKGGREFKRAYPDLRSVMAGHSMFLHVVVRSDSGIKRIQDLKGKKIALGPQGSSTNVQGQIVLNYYGLAVNKDYKPYWLSHSEGADALRNKTVDAQFGQFGYPSPTFSDLAQSVEVKFLPIDEKALNSIIAEHSYWYVDRMPAGTYKGIQQELLGLGSVSTLITNAKVPEQVVYDLTKAVIEYNSEIAQVTVLAKSWNLKDCLRAVSVPLHPGAAKYFREKGAKIPPALMPK